MRDLLPNVLPSVFYELPGFRLYAVCALILVLKMQAVGVYTARTRFRYKALLNPEDAVRVGVPVVEVEHPEVQRAHRAHRNDLENIPAFLALGLIAVLAGAPPVSLQICFVGFTAARVLHSVAYLRGLQPWRSIAFGLGMLASVTLMVQIGIRALG